MKKSNELIHESSPYLLQHAYNPVDWKAWNKESLALAKKQNKPLLISIGYSACHWCHVMEKESFEDQSLAKLMNDHFVCIKVDREERPDLDQLYMTAVQAMSGRGGWPLNCFATPDGRPFYGGTYFPPEQWENILTQLANVYEKEPQKVEEYAVKLTKGVQTASLIEKNENQSDFNLAVLNTSLKKWIKAFDPEDGGNNQAPKFPVPNNYQFLLHYNYYAQNKQISQHLELSLKKMAYGGIYDQVGGGFARYATDMQWKIPHFEKMLYDNAQLISLYSEAHRQNPKTLYKDVVAETVAFCKRELLDESGSFYSALDADSEGEEGKYYVWKRDELKAILKDDFDLFAKHFNVNTVGLWENGNYILMQTDSLESLAKDAGLELETYRNKINSLKEKLLNKRDEREKPGLDDKSLTSWNALMIKGLCDAYLSFHDDSYLELAEDCAKFILRDQKKTDQGLWHSYKKGKSSINGYLEDYSFCIEAFVALYQCSLNETYLEQAKSWCEFVLTHFFNEEANMFYFTSDEDEALFSRSMEVDDNVIPSSNSSMAKALMQVGILYHEEKYQEISRQMLRNMEHKFEQYLPGASNWAQLLLWNTKTFYELAIVGDEAQKAVKDWHINYTPNVIVLGLQEANSTLPLLQNKWSSSLRYYLCYDKSCRQAVETRGEILAQMEEN